MKLPGQALVPFMARALALGIACLAWAGCRHPSQRPLVRHEFQSVQMAIPFRIVLYARDGQQATNAARAAWERIGGLNQCLSDYDPASELSWLGSTSPHARPVPVSDDLYRVLRRAQEVSRASDGAFDITVGPLTQLWRRSRRQRELPDAPRLRAALDATGWQHVELHQRPRPAARLLRPGMRLDAGGIAKGFALDEATRVLREHGVGSSLVSGAGDIVVIAGGVIPPKDHDFLKAHGVACVFGPGTPIPQAALAVLDAIPRG